MGITIEDMPSITTDMCCPRRPPASRLEITCPVIILSLHRPMGFITLEAP